MYQRGNAGAGGAGSPEALGWDHERFDAAFIFLAALFVDMFIL